MVTIPTIRLPSSSSPRRESTSRLDLNKYTQSELCALAQTSNTAFNLPCTDDLIIPQIDPSVFNESAASRRQTYHRLFRRRIPNLSSSSAASGRRPRLASVLPSSAEPLPASYAEDRLIVKYIKELLMGKNNSNALVVHNHEHVRDDTNQAIQIDTNNAVVEDMAIVVHNSSDSKRKRGRKPKAKVLENGNNEIELEIVNKNGVVVDFVELAKADELYNAELRRSTEGLRTEEEMLGFLRELDGEWCSRRKRRKFVDASGFGEKLPVGWKLLLGMRRREGSVSVYCRRYISPTGQHFLSCKEVSSYLQSYFGNHAKQLLDPRDEVVSASYAGFVGKDNQMQINIIGNSTLSVQSVSDANGNEASLLGMENLAEVHVRDIFDCDKCNVTFDEKDKYLQHLLSVHQNTTRRYRVGASVGEGVIIKDGKYECQFCHKVFQERRSYNGHVGVHVRTQIRNSKESPSQLVVQKTTEPPSLDGLPSRKSNMVDLAEAAHMSALESDRTIERPNGGSSPNKECTGMTVQVPSEMEFSMAEAALDQELKHHRSEHINPDEKVLKFGRTSDRNNVNMGCTSTSDHLKLNEAENHGKSGLEIISGDIHVKPIAVATNTTKKIEENTIQSGASDSSLPLVQSHCIPAFNTKEKNKLYAADQKIDNGLGFEELTLDVIEALNVQQSPFFPEVSMDLDNVAVMEEGVDSSVRLESETVILNKAGRRVLRTVCVWCRNEFNHEAIDFEAQSDSIGYMCPTCKAKISGQLDSGLSMHSRKR